MREIFKHWITRAFPEDVHSSLKPARQGNGKSICGVVGSGRRIQTQLAHHGFENLVLVRMTMAGQSLLDLHWRKFDHRQSESAEGHDHDPAGLDHGDRIAGAIEEKLFNRGQFRAPCSDQLAQISGDLDHSFSLRSPRIGADDAAIKHGLLTTGGVDHPVTNPGEAGVDAEYAHG